MMFYGLYSAQVRLLKIRFFKINERKMKNVLLGLTFFNNIDIILLYQTLEHFFHF